MGDRDSHDVGSIRRVPTLDQLIRTHERDIRKIINGRSGARLLRVATQEDLFQETVSTALASRASFKYVDKKSFLAWMTTIARRTICRVLPDRTRQLEATRIRGVFSSGDGISEDELPAGIRTPSSVVAFVERENWLERAIQDLPEHYGVALRLYKIEERSLAEVARRLDRSKVATCVIVTRALEHLRRAADDDELDI